MSEDGLLVGGEPAAILAASSALHEVAFRTDNVGASLAAALAPATTTAVVAAPFAPAEAQAVEAALAVVMGSPGAGLPTVAAAYELASTQMRLAGQALEAAGIAGIMATGGLALLKGGPPSILPNADGIDLRREAMSLGGSVDAYGRNGTVGVRQLQRPDGSTFYVVEAITSPRAAASLGAQLNGVGAFVEGATGAEVTARWAVATKEEAEAMVAAATLSLAPGAGEQLMAHLPRPTEMVMGTALAATLVGSPLIPVASGSATLTARNEMTFRQDGGTRLAATVSGSGQVALPGVAGVGGGGSLKVGLERDATGRVTKLTLATATEVDRGRHGLAPIESLNREATLEEKEWELEVTPEVRAHADRIADAITDGRAPDGADLRALSNAVADVEPTVRSYDVRHQQISADGKIGPVGAGASLGIDTATLRNP